MDVDFEKAKIAGRFGIVMLTRKQIFAVLWAIGNFTDYEGTGDPTLDGPMRRAEKRLTEVYASLLKEEAEEAMK